jgi:hypothetical protein
MNAAAHIDVEPVPLEIDPRACELCGLKIDRHEMIDDGEGPEFFCLSPDELTLPELELRAELIRQVEVAAILARMDAMQGPSECPPPRERELEPYRSAAATVSAFWYLINLQDAERFKTWLADRPQDAPFLLQLLEGK